MYDNTGDARSAYGLWNNRLVFDVREKNTEIFCNLMVN